jgi:GYF domain
LAFFSPSLHTIHIYIGPWKADLMQSWYKDGLLPPDLPVRREEDTEYILLRDLRLQCVDPTQPFGSPLPQIVQPIMPTDDRPLLKPISLLAQPSHFGPPALFFSSRGGHSTTIVDARGRLVLKGRFFWSPDNIEDGKLPVPAGQSGRMGDVKRLESIDMNDRSILIAMRQGGLEAVDLTDALLRPADGSRTLFPHFNPPSSSFNRRGPFVWRMGTPISIGSSSVDAVALKPSASRGALKKLSTGPGKTTGRQEMSVHGETEGDHTIQDEILFLGRKDDALYLCERNSGSFRILQLCPAVS